MNLSKQPITLQVSEHSKDKSKTEVSKVVLPFFAGVSAGFVPSVSFAYRSHEGSDKKLDDLAHPNLLGFQPVEIKVDIESGERTDLHR